MWVERLKIQVQIVQAWMKARVVKNAPIASVKEAIGALEKALQALDAFNAAHPLIGRFLRVFDRKLCIHPLNLRIALLRAKVAKVEMTTRPHFSKKASISISSVFYANTPSLWTSFYPNSRASPTGLREKWLLGNSRISLRRSTGTGKMKGKRQTKAPL